MTLEGGPTSLRLLRITLSSIDLSGKSSLAIDEELHLTELTLETKEKSLESFWHGLKPSLSGPYFKVEGALDGSRQPT